MRIFVKMVILTRCKVFKVTVNHYIFSFFAHVFVCMWENQRSGSDS